MAAGFASRRLFLKEIKIVANGNKGVVNPPAGMLQIWLFKPTIES
jgi:hypothetical protein